MAKRMTEILNERRNETTLHVQHGRPLWLSINRNPEALAVWQDWVMAAPNAEEMYRRGQIAFAAEKGERS
jgi:predicted secreted protein